MLHKMASNSNTFLPLGIGAITMKSPPNDESVLRIMEREKSQTEYRVALVNNPPNQISWEVISECWRRAVSVTFKDRARLLSHSKMEENDSCRKEETK